MRITTRIQRPSLTPEERAKRLDAIKAAAARLVLATDQQQQKERTDTDGKHN